jgi:hypothetical protein
MLESRDVADREDRVGSGSDGGRSPRRLAVSGASGLVGSALTARLAREGHRVHRLVRGEAAGTGEDIAWDPERGRLDPGGLRGVDAVVHLAGASVAGGRWTSARKALIRDSRIAGTRLLAETLGRLAPPPRVLVSASAIGYYGDRGDEPLTEAAPPGEGFLAEVCQAWEAATGAARDAGIRVVCLRIGMVLAARGGALGRMLLPFRLGLGGVVGSGRQYVSWIALTDLVAAIRHAIRAETLVGPVNAVAPGAVTNREFTETLGRVLGRPTLAPLPAPVVHLLFGEMGRALLLASARVVPERLRESAFAFAHPDLEGALRAELGGG